MCSVCKNNMARNTAHIQSRVHIKNLILYFQKIKDGTIRNELSQYYA